MRNHQQDNRRGLQGRGSQRGERFSSDDRSYAGGDNFGTGYAPDYQERDRSGGDFEQDRGENRYYGQDYRRSGQQPSERDRENFEREHYWNRDRPGYGQFGQAGGYGEIRQDFRERSDWDQQGGSMYENRYRGGQDEGRYGGGGRQEAGHGSQDWNQGIQSGNFYGRSHADPGMATHRDLRANRKGPKGYSRSDERVKEDVCDRLTDAYDLDVEDISIEVSQGKVTITGTVPERHMKHRIEDIACTCSGVKDVDNNVRVASRSSGDEKMGGQPGQQASGKKREQH